jgi:hypothetical protein
MRERLFAPLGLAKTVTLPEEAIIWDVAAGHIITPDGPVVAPVWALMRNAGPAGLIDCAIEDLLKFARMHLKQGVAEDGTQIIKPETAAEMIEFSADVPEKYLLGDSWGLGVTRFDWGGKRVYGHDGNTIGQAAFLRWYPEGNFAVGLLTNEGSSHELYLRLYTEIFEALGGVEVPGMIEVPDEPPQLDITPWLGKYERASVEINIYEGEDGPHFKAEQKGELAEIDPNSKMDFLMKPVREGLYAVWVDEMQVEAPVWFYQIPSGERYIHFGARATRKVA